MSATALRVLFHHEAGAISLVAVKDVAARVPPSADLSTSPGSAHFYFEVQAPSGAPLYRRAKPNPAGPSFEVPTGNIERPFEYREATSDPAGYFSFLVPKLADGRFVELFGSDAPGMAPPGSLGRFDLTTVGDSWILPEPGR